MTLGVLRRPGSVAILVALGLILAGAGLGWLYPQVAYRFGPGLLPSVLALGGLLVLTLQRPVWGIVVALLLLPLGNLGFALGPPWLLGTAWSVLLALMALLSGPATTGEAQARYRALPLTWAFLSLVLVTILGWIVAGEAETAVPVTRALLTGGCLFWAMLVFVRRTEDVRLILVGFAGGALLVGGYAVIQYLGEEVSSGFFTSGGALVSRVSAGFGQPNQLGGFLVLVLPFVLAGALASGRRLPWLAVLAIATFAVYASFSRGALIALVLVPLVFVGGRRIFLAAPLLVLLVAFATPDLVRERFATVTESGSEVATRADFYETALEIWLRSPFLGVGPGGFPAAYAEARVPGKGFVPATLFQPPPHAHNLALQLLSEQGLLGLLAFTAVVVLAARAALLLRKSQERMLSLAGTAVLGTLVAVLVHNLVDVTLLETTAVYFWAVLGVAAAATGILVRSSADAERDG
ncbi:MAG: O-antigen ligase family protein [Actinomycetota bacterium]|nr:O-antigen ligase family protein [Actinomycetota bacterium]